MPCMKEKTSRPFSLSVMHTQPPARAQGLFSKRDDVRVCSGHWPKVGRYASGRGYAHVNGMEMRGWEREVEDAGRVEGTSFREVTG
jgi:hypothetical protein